MAAPESQRNVSRVLSPFEKALEEYTGISIEEMRDIAPEDLRKRIENQFGKPTEFVSEWPIAEGRGHW